MTVAKGLDYFVDVPNDEIVGICQGLLRLELKFI